MRTYLRPAAILIAAALVVGACSSDSADDPGAAPVLRVFSNYRGADAEAFRTVLAQFTRETGIATSYVGTAAFADRIRDRVREGDPPDVALFPQPAILAEMARAGFVAELDGDLAEGVENGYPDWAIELGTVEGGLYGVPYRVSVKSLVWYPPGVFAERGYDVPETWDELTTLADQMVSDGYTPWCMGMEAFGATGWVGTDWIEDIVLRFGGPEVYDPWAAGDVPFTDDPIRTAFEQFGDVLLRPGRVAGGVRAVLAVPVLDAIQAMFSDPPGCLLSRQASFQREALPAGTEIGPSGDVDVFVLPSADRGNAPLLVSGEIAAAFTDSEEARALLTYLSSPDSGVPWAALGGYNSPHAGFDTAAYGSDFERRLGELLETADVVRFDGSDLMPPAVGTGTFWAGMVDFVAGSSLETVLAEIEAGYDQGAS